MRLKGDHSEQHGHCWNIMNFICPMSILQHCLFHQVFAVFANQSELLIHNGVGWISKGKVLGQEIVFFLAHITTSSNPLGMPAGFCMFMAQVFFLWYLNTLNLDVQEQKSTADQVGRPCTFKTDLRIFTNDLSVQMLHLPHLPTFMNPVYGAQITHDDRFHGEIHWEHSVFPSRYWKKDPFSIKPGPDLRICESKRCYLLMRVFQMGLVEVLLLSGMIIYDTLD